MRIILTSLIASLAILISGCSTLSKSECLTADWRLIGFDDGAKGYEVSRIGAHRQACADHGVTPNLSEYEAGYSDGVRKFCTVQKGYNKGLSGWQYNGICPADLEFNFLQAYDDGYELYEINKEIDDIEDEIKEIDDEIALLDVEKKRLEAKIISDDSSEEVKQIALEDLTMVIKDIKDKEFVKDRLILDMQDLQDDYDYKREVRDSRYYQ